MTTKTRIIGTIESIAPSLMDLPVMPAVNSEPSPSTSASTIGTVAAIPMIVIWPKLRRQIVNAVSTISIAERGRSVGACIGTGG